MICLAHRHTGLTRLLALLLAIALLSGTAALAAQTEEAAPAAAIYTTSNMLGEVYAQDPLTGQTEEATYLKVATAMAQERKQMSDTLLLDAGNAVSTGLTDDDGQAVALALRHIGYDALVPGVEEFRLGAGYCQNFLQALGTSGGVGTPVEVLSGNLLDSQGNPVAVPYQVYSLTLGNQSVRVGVLGLGGIDTARQLPDRLYGNVRFAHAGNEKNSYLWEWNYWKPQLEQENCDLVVVVCHAGPDELAQLAAATTGIDLLVGGDGPAAAGSLDGANGEKVPYVCGGGSSLTRTMITLDERGTPVVADSALLDLTGYENDGDLSRALASHNAAAKQAGSRRVGTLSGTWEDSFSLTRQTDTADLVGETMLWATDADAALISLGSLSGRTAASLFEKKSTAAALTLSDCAQLVPDLSPVVTVKLTGAQLRQWLEVCAGRYTVNAAGQPMGGKDADVLYGMDYSLYLGNPAGKRVGLLLLDGEPVSDSQEYTVAVSADRLADPQFPQCQVSWSASADRDFASHGGSAAALLAAYAQDTAHQSRTLVPTRSSTWFIYPEAFNAPLTRLEFVEMLYDLAGRPQPGANYAFTDVNGSDAVIWAAETRVVTGDGRGKFLPLTVVTKEQAAVMIYNYVRSLGKEMPQATGITAQLLDGAAISSWARPAVDFCLSAGIIPAAGTREDLYLPGSSIARSEAALYLTNLKNYLA